jgi:hypothetical protein
LPILIDGSRGTVEIVSAGNGVGGGGGVVSVVDAGAIFGVQLTTKRKKERARARILDMTIGLGV